MLGTPVGRLDPAQAQEGEQVPAFVGEVAQQPAVGRVVGRPGDELVDLGVQAVGLGGQGRPVQGAGLVGGAQRQGVLQEAAHRVGGLGLPRDGVADELAAAPEQVRQAALVGRGGELAVGRPAVAFQHPAVALAEHHSGVVVAAAGGDPVDGDALADKGPQPRPPAADPPASLVGGDHRAGPHPLGQRLVGRLHPPGGAGDRLGDPAGGDGDAKLGKQPGGLGGRHP
jgi:hypothetical protein